MNPFEFVIAIISLSFGYKLLCVWLNNKNHRREDEATTSIAARLGQIEERVQVLERIVTDDRYDLKQQFKDLGR